MRRWLFASNPSRYSIHDLRCDRVTPWESICDQQSCKHIRGDVRPGDTIFFYHIGPVDPAITGLALICSDPYPEELKEETRIKVLTYPCNEVRHYLVDLKFVGQLELPITQSELAGHCSLGVLPNILPEKDGAVMQLTEFEWKTILALRPDPVGAFLSENDSHSVVK